MHSLTTRFAMPPETDWDALRKAAPERAQLYVRVPGLRSKTFALDAEAGEYGAHYLFESRRALEDFLASELFGNIVRRFGQPVQLKILEVPAVVEHGHIFR